MVKCENCVGTQYINVESYFFDIIKPRSIKCTVTDREISLYKEQLRCVLSKLKGKTNLRYSYFINQFINSNDFCKYNLKLMQEMITKFACV